MSVHLRSIALRRDSPLPKGFPFDVPVIQHLDHLHFSQPLTFFVGENGSGKSTVLEAIAVAAELPTIGSSDAQRDESLAGVRPLSDRLKWVWSKRTRSGFFMRSEDFFGYAKRINTELAYYKARLEDDSLSHPGQSEFARRLSKLGDARSYQALQSSYGDGLEAQSHGESYFKLFRARFRAGGLYLMDEPEAPLSPNRQLTLMSLLSEMIKQEAQFIIATHSPILLAYPNATIYEFAHGQITETTYDSLEHVQITRDFLNDPQAYLRHLLA